MPSHFAANCSCSINSLTYYLAPTSRYAHMTKTLSVIAITILFLSACKPDLKKEEIAIRHQYCIRQIEENTDLLRKMEDETRNTTNPKIKRIVWHSINFDSIRLKYHQNLNRRDLFAFADSVGKELTATRQSRELNSKIGIIKDMLRATQNLAEIKIDSLSILDLYFWSVVGENFLLEKWYSSTTCCVDRFMTIIPSFVDNSFKLSDTVIVSFPRFNQYDWNFSKVMCTNTVTGTSIKPRIIKTGRTNFLFYYPKERGEYLIAGTIRLTVDNVFENELEVHNNFTVQ